MAFITEEIGYMFIVIFGLSMVTLTYLSSMIKKSNTQKSFLVAGRNVGWFVGGTSIAASWIWAPALFVSVQLAYQKGLAGIFWFTFPNMVALLIFAWLGPTIRKKMPKGYTLPQYIRYRLQSEKVHKIYLFPYLFYQLMAITVQIYAGGSLFNLLTGIPLVIIMPILLVIALAYTYISGLEASIITDFVQMALIVVIGAIILPMTWSSAGGVAAIIGGIHGIDNIGNIFDHGVAFSLGIVTSIGLIAGAISDQQYWQRAFAIKKKDLRKAFIFGAMLFGIVPLGLSTLGFIGANPDVGIVLPNGVDSSMIGVQTVVGLLPDWAVFLFIIMLLSGLSSTLDSGLSAASSLFVSDIARCRTNRNSIRSARNSMFAMAILGLAIALAIVFVPQFGLFHLWWVFNTIAACVVVPTILSLFWDRLDARGVLWGVGTSFVIGLPLFIYGNILENELMIVCASLFIIGISTIFCLIFRKSTISYFSCCI